VTGTIACLDAAYSETSAGGACALLPTWEAAKPLCVRTCRQGIAAPYEPGSLYKRELPILLALLQQLEQHPATIIVDGYVWLDGDHRPGLGAILYQRSPGKAPSSGWPRPALVTRRGVFLSCEARASGHFLFRPSAWTRKRPLRACTPCTGDTAFPLCCSSLIVRHARRCADLHQGPGLTSSNP
jgi:Endonuclease V